VLPVDLCPGVWDNERVDTKASEEFQMINSTLSLTNGSIFFILFAVIAVAIYLGVKQDRKGDRG
jgi:hypothetical protein